MNSLPPAAREAITTLGLYLKQIYELTKSPVPVMNSLQEVASEARFQHALLEKELTTPHPANAPQDTSERPAYRMGEEFGGFIERLNDYITELEDKIDVMRGAVPKTVSAPQDTTAKGEGMTVTRDCWKCGESNEEGANICTSCGAENPWGERPAVPSSNVAPQDWMRETAKACAKQADALIKATTGPRFTITEIEGLFAELIARRAPDSTEDSQLLDCVEKNDLWVGTKGGTRNAGDEDMWGCGKHLGDGSWDARGPTLRSALRAAMVRTPKESAANSARDGAIKERDEARNMVTFMEREHEGACQERNSLRTQLTSALARIAEMEKKP